MPLQPRTLRLSLIIALLAPLITAYAQPQPSTGPDPDPELAAPSPRVVAVRGEAPELDGVIEPLWQDAPPTTEFIQLTPRSGEPSAWPTEVRVRYTDDALFVAYALSDPHPDSLRGQLQRRDRSDRSSTVGLLLSPYGDARNGFFFQVTAAGVQVDGVISNVSHFDKSWDGVWQSAVAANDSGWVAEMRIPFATFRHADPSIHAWTIGFDRYVYRADEWSAWPVGDRLLGQRTDRFATLTGLAGIPGSAHLEVIPHAVARWNANEYAGRWHSANSWENLGVTAKAVLSPSWSVDATYQPDFAQVEVDDEVINLSDYPVFLTEKRPFFLEGLDLFQETDIRLLYTRRIANPEYGVRVTGQEQTLRSSALYARNVNADGMREDAFAARSLAHVGGRHTAGVTLTHLDGDTMAVSAASLDGTLRWGRRNEWRTVFAASDRPGWRRQPLSVESHLFWVLRPRYELTYDFGYRGRDFHINDLGWGRYSDQIWNWTRFARRFFPQQGAAEWVNVFLHGYHEMHADGRYTFGNGYTGFSTGLHSKISFGVNGSVGTQVRRNYLNDGDPAPADAMRDNFGFYQIERYPARGIHGWLSSDPRRLLQWGVGVGHATLRDGLRVYVDPWLTATLRENLSLNLNLDWTHTWGVGDIQDGDPADYRVWRLRGDWSPSLPTSLRATLQYVEQPDGDRIGLANLVAAWNWRPGSWLYAVYSEQRETDADLQRFGRTRPGDRTVQLKGTWYFIVG